MLLANTNTPGSEKNMSFFFFFFLFTVTLQMKLFKRPKGAQNYVVLFIHVYLTYIQANLSIKILPKLTRTCIRLLVGCIVYLGQINFSVKTKLCDRTNTEEKLCN